VGGPIIPGMNKPNHVFNGLIDSATALREAKVIRDSAHERALAHERERLFCSNMKPVGKY
jgi:hypothetical protein